MFIYTTIISTIMNTKSYSIEEMAKKLTKLKNKKEKLDESITDLQSQLDEALKTLGITPRVIYKEVEPYIWTSPIITGNLLPADVNMFTPELNFRSNTIFNT